MDAYLTVEYPSEHSIDALVPTEYMPRQQDTQTLPRGWKKEAEYDTYTALGK